MYPAHLEVFELNQKNIYYSEKSRFVLAGKGEEAIVSFTEQKLGDIANKLIHIINPTANNSSNYVKQIPFIEPTQEQRKIVEDCVKQILELDVVEDAKAITELHLFINEAFDHIYS